MASAETALAAALSADAGFAAQADGRIFPAGGRQGVTYPYATYQRISTTGAKFLDGASNLDWPRFQIDSWGRTALEAIALAEAIRAAIDNVTIAGDPRITATFQDQSGPAPDEETRNFRVSQDYLIFHERS
ncbi:DUF3168 domain-containing protein [Sphingobium sp. CFD-2]|uniref:DUF3168 domain-containing protein n=1 Tax=Sphingobium sp. CFD-2 TaxID=2878542 RepID=UPI00214CF9B3|nr:DUF3168 domain-containing protein [Sphingobium sp. CFD-2]